MAKSAELDLRVFKSVRVKAPKVSTVLPLPLPLTGVVGPVSVPASTKCTVHPVTRAP